jgi:adiponectin receptor
MLRAASDAALDALGQLPTAVASKMRRDVTIFDIPVELRRPYILTSYRANHTLRECLRSLCLAHNETVNVWTHIIGCVLFVIIFVHATGGAVLEGLPPHVAESLRSADGLERWPLYVFLASALACLSLSAVYHLIGTANVRWHSSFESFDYFGIIALIVGSCFPVVHYGFGPAFPNLRRMYLLTICLLGVVLAKGTVHRGGFFEHTWTRVSLFIALALSGVVALLHAVIAHDFSPTTTSLLKGVLQMGATYLLGVGFYVLNLPERCAPRRFDIIGSSHNFWHVCVMLAAYLHWQTVLNLWRHSAMVQPPAQTSNLDVTVSSSD